MPLSRSTRSGLPRTSSSRSRVADRCQTHTRGSYPAWHLCGGGEVSTEEYRIAQKSRTISNKRHLAQPGAWSTLFLPLCHWFFFLFLFFFSLFYLPQLSPILVLPSLPYSLWTAAVSATLRCLDHGTALLPVLGSHLAYHIPPVHHSSPRRTSSVPSFLSPYFFPFFLSRFLSVLFLSHLHFLFHSHSSVCFSFFSLLPFSSSFLGQPRLVLFGSVRLNRVLSILTFSFVFIFQSSSRLLFFHSFALYFLPHTSSCFFFSILSTIFTHRILHRHLPMSPSSLTSTSCL